MAELRLFDANSNIERWTLKNSSTGQGLTGLTSASAGLIIGTICDNEATTTTYTQAAGNIEGIATLGTYAAPTASKCRLKEVDATNHPGLYEFQFADARYSVASARKLVISVSGAANLLAADYEIALVRFDPYDSNGLGLSFAALVTAIWAAATRSLTDKIDFALTSAYNPAKTAAQAGDAMALTSGERTTLAASIWNALTSGMSTVGSIGKKLADWVLGADGKAVLSSDPHTGAVIPLVTTTTTATNVTNDVGITQAGADKVWGSATRTLTSLGASLVQEIWDRATSALTTAGSIGKLLVDNINATISSRSSHSAADVWAAATRTLTAFSFSVTVGTNSDKTGYSLSAAGIQAVWDALTSALTTAGSIGKKLADWALGSDNRALVSANAHTSGQTVAAVTADVGITQAAADKVFGASGAALPELTQAAPSATPTPREAIMLPYMAMRDKLTTDATSKKIHNDAGTVICKKALSDDGTTYTEAEMVAGP